MDKHKRNNWDFETSMKNMLFPWFFPLVHTTDEDLSSGFSHRKCHSTWHKISC